jgi:hypothetical protein
MLLGKKLLLVVLSLLLLSQQDQLDPLEFSLDLKWAMVSHLGLKLFPLFTLLLELNLFELHLYMCLDPLQRALYLKPDEDYDGKGC